MSNTKHHQITTICTNIISYSLPGMGGFGPLDGPGVVFPELVGVADLGAGVVDFSRCKIYTVQYKYYPSHTNYC